MQQKVSPEPAMYMTEASGNVACTKDCHGASYMLFACYILSQSMCCSSSHGRSLSSYSTLSGVSQKVECTLPGPTKCMYYTWPYGSVLLIPEELIESFCP